MKDNKPSRLSLFKSESIVWYLFFIKHGGQLFSRTDITISKHKDDNNNIQFQSMNKFCLLPTISRPPSQSTTSMFFLID